MATLLTATHYSSWLALLDVPLDKALQKISERAWTAENFRFATAVSVMSSSKIEGETLEVDSYVKHKMLDIEYLPNLVEKPNDLYAAYEFAKDHPLSKNHFHETHRLATLHLLPVNQRGKVRKGNMLIIDARLQQVQYEAAPATVVAKEYDVFWEELEELLKANLTIEQVFYYAALIHLVFVKIHPFDDGNGRTARLLEKWFLATQLGERAWYIPSELFYYQNLQSYYHNLARVGLFYETLAYEKSVPFLLMLAQSLVFKK